MGKMVLSFAFKGKPCCRSRWPTTEQLSYQSVNAVDYFMLLSGVWLMPIAAAMHCPSLCLFQASICSLDYLTSHVYALWKAHMKWNLVKFQLAEHIQWTHGSEILILYSVFCNGVKSRADILNNSKHSWRHQESVIPLPTPSFHCSYLICYADYLESAVLSFN